MIYLKLFVTFFQIGMFAFGGGYAVLPLIQRFVVDNQGWLTMQEMVDIVTISQMTPGPISINAATFVGTEIAGITGAVVASMGSVTPPLLFSLFMGFLIFKNKKIDFLEKILGGLRPGVVGLIGAAAVSMLVSSVWPEGAISYLALTGFIVGFMIQLFKKVDLITLILFGAVIGVVGQILIMLF